VTDLVFRVGGEILAIKMCGQYDTSGRVWVFCTDHICEVLRTIWRSGYKTILFYVPIELAERGDEVIANEGMILSVGCISVSQRHEVRNKDAHAF
jgi:hypothetical protein